MGWMSFRMNQPVKEWFVKDFEGTGCEVLDVALVKRNTLYAAVKNKEDGSVICLVYLIRWSKGEYNFSYKPMSEFVGPCECECPERIFKLLTPLDETDHHGFAGEWREKVKRIHQFRKDPYNYIVKTNYPVSFTCGLDFTYFKRVNNKWLAGDLHDNGNFDSKIRVSYNPLQNGRFELIPLV